MQMNTIMNLQNLQTQYSSLFTYLHAYHPFPTELLSPQLFFPCCWSGYSRYSQACPSFWNPSSSAQPSWVGLLAQKTFTTKQLKFLSLSKEPTLRCRVTNLMDVDLQEISTCWKFSLVGFFIGKAPIFFF